MNAIIHDSDDLFSTAYKNYREEPSSGVWDKLSARLDKKDAIYYRLHLEEECSDYAYMVAGVFCSIRVTCKQNN